MSAQNGNKVLCSIALKDGSMIEVVDIRQIQNCLVLENLTEIFGGKCCHFSMLDFEPDHVRFVLDNIVPYSEHIENFLETEQYRNGADYNVNDVLKYMEVANFLDCQPMLRGLGIIAAHLVGDCCEKEISSTWGYEDYMSEEKKEEILEQTTWMLPK